jgi:hypothetical protein
LEFDSSALQKGENVEIKFQIRNATNSKIFISDPFGWVNVGVLLYEDEKLVRPSIRVRADISWREKKISIEPFEIRSFKFSISLNRIYTNLFFLQGKLQVKIFYRGYIFDHEMKPLLKGCHVNSNLVNIVQ